MEWTLGGRNGRCPKTAGFSRMACLAVSGLAALFAASTAVAAPTTPSTAHQLQVGVPWSSSMSDWYSEWLRLPEAMGPGDTITFASEADTDIRYCLVPAADDFGAEDTNDACDWNGYPSTYPHVDLDPGKFRRTLKWTAPESHGFLLVHGYSAKSTRYFRPTIYSAMVENVEHYVPDFTPPTMAILDRRARLARGHVTKVRIACPASEASPPCSGSVLATTRGRVRLRGTRRLLMLGRTTFSLGANETGLIRLRLNQRRIKLLLRGRKSRVIHLTVRAKDKAGNRSAQQFNLRLVRP